MRSGLPRGKVIGEDKLVPDAVIAHDAGVEEMMIPVEGLHIGPASALKVETAISFVRSRLRRASSMSVEAIPRRR